MHLKQLILRHFRNYKSADVHFSPGMNWIQGENGQGKTNLLEAIYFLSTGRSFRASSLSDLISFNESFFYIEGRFEKDGVEQEIKVYYDKESRRVQHNQTIYPTLTSVLGILPSILLSPDDLSLISGSPSERRRFLDLYIAQTDPLYVFHLGRYFKAMKQRNALLKNKSEAAMDAWEQTMAESASYLVFKRRSATEELKAPSSKWMQILSSQKEALRLSYSPSLSTHLSPHFAKQWKMSRGKEMQIGSTLMGPHRDDLSIYLEEKEAKQFSSEGQKRSCISSLRFAQWEQICETAGYPPLLGIDDFGIQLDPIRQSQLKNHLPQFNQVFLTSPHRLESSFTQGNCASFHVASGTLSAC